MKGYIEVYTGDGKGKTTAAIGLAVRAVGAGKKVCFIQFMKSLAYSEQKILQGLPGLTLITLGKPYFIAKEGMLSEEEIKAWGSALRVYPAGHPPKEYRDMVLKGIEDAVKAVSPLLWKSDREKHSPDLCGVSTKVSKYIISKPGKVWKK